MYANRDGQLARQLDRCLQVSLTDLTYLKQLRKYLYKELLNNTKMSILPTTEAPPKG